MKSAVIQQDHDDLIALNKALLPEERLTAFYHHSFLVGKLSVIQKAPVQGETGVAIVHSEIHLS